MKHNPTRNEISSYHFNFSSDTRRMDVGYRKSSCPQPASLLRFVLISLQNGHERFLCDDKYSAIFSCFINPSPKLNHQRLWRSSTPDKIWEVLRTFQLNSAYGRIQVGSMPVPIFPSNNPTIKIESHQ